MLMFKDAKALIIGGGNIELLNNLSFDINTIQEDRIDFDFHDSSNYTWYTSIQETILHVAIIAGNLRAIEILIAKGAKSDISREQKYLSSGNAFMGGGIWSEPEITSSGEKTETCMDLARGNSAILALLIAPPVCVDSSIPSTSSGGSQDIGSSDVSVISPEALLQAQMRQAQTHVDQGEYAQAQASYLAMLEQPVMRTTYNYVMLGFVTASLGQLKEAKAYYRKALQLNPESADALSSLGDLYRLQGDLAQDNAFDLHIRAKVYLEAAAVAGKENNPHGALFLARLLFPTLTRKTQNMSYQIQARNILLTYYDKRVSQESKGAVDCRMLARACIDLSNIEESTPILDYQATLKWRELAIAYIEQALMLNSKSVLARVEHAYMYFVMRQYGKAAEIIAEVLVTHPYSPEAQIVNQKIERARQSIALMETHQPLVALRQPGFCLLGRQIELKVSHPSSDASKAAFLVTKIP